MTGHAKIVSTNAIHPDAVAMLEPYGGLVLPDDPSDAALYEVAGDADILIVRRRLPDDIFDRTPRLKAAVRHGIGLDFIPVEAASEAGIIVANLPDANTNAVVEHVAGLMFQIARKYGELDSKFRGGDWDIRNSSGAFELSGRTLGVVGLGRIGRRVAALASQGFGMKVLGFDPALSEAPDGVSLTDLDTIFRTSDMVTLHVPLTDRTREFVGEELLSAMRQDAWIINASRGEVIDDAALVAALKAHRIGGAALDVFHEEPLPADSPFRPLDNIILTPHSASLTGESIRRMGVGSAEEVIRVLEGNPPENFLNAEIWDRSRLRGA